MVVLASWIHGIHELALCIQSWVRTCGSVWVSYLRVVSILSTEQSQFVDADGSTLHRVALQKMPIRLLRYICLLISYDS